MMNPQTLRRFLAATICLFVASSVSASPGSWPFESNESKPASDAVIQGECLPECSDSCIDFSALPPSDYAKVGSAWQTLTSDIVVSPNMTADAGDFLGTSVAVFGDHMVAVAALENYGNLYFYRRIGEQWVFQSRRAASQSGVGTGIRPYLYDKSGSRMILGGAFGQFIIVRFDGEVWRTEPIAAGVIESNPAATGVAIDGDRAVVTYVGLRKIKVLAFDGSSWLVESEWMLPDAEWNQYTLLSADLESDRLLIGHPAKTIAGTSSVGEVLVYQRQGALWSLDAILMPPEVEADLRFGFSVALDGDLIAAGAWGDDVGARANAGSVSVFRKVGGSWTREHTLTPDATPADGGFGWRSRFAGGHLYVSQYGTLPAAFDGGLFEYDLSTQTPTILNHLVQPGFYDRLGTGFDVVGSELFAGTPGRSIGGGIKAFARVGSNWVLNQLIQQEASVPASGFGHEVAVSGTHLLVRERKRPVSGGVDEPVVHAYERRGSQWQRVQTLRVPAGPNVGFGMDMAVRGNLALISRVDNSQRTAALHTYRFDGDQWQHVDTADLAPLVATFSFMYGVEISFVHDGVVVGLSGFSTSEQTPSHEIRVFGLSSDGLFAGWDTLTAPNPSAWRGYGPTIAADGDWVAVHDSYGVVTDTQVRAVTSVFRRNGSGWVRLWDIPSPVAQPIGACGIGATIISGGLAVLGDRMYVGVGGGELAPGTLRGASIDSYDLNPSMIPQRVDSMPATSLQLLARDGRVALFKDGGLSFFDPTTHLSAQAPLAIVPPRTYYAPIVDFSAAHVAFGVPSIGEPNFMGEVHVLSLGPGFNEVAVPIFGSGALIALILVMGVIARSRLPAQPRVTRR